MIRAQRVTGHMMTTSICCDLFEVEESSFPIRREFVVDSLIHLALTQTILRIRYKNNTAQLRMCELGSMR